MGLLSWTGEKAKNEVKEIAGIARSTSDIDGAKRRFGWIIADFARVLGPVPSEIKADPETFEQAVKRFNLSDQDIYDREVAFRRFARIFGTSMLLAPVLMIYFLSIPSVLTGVGAAAFSGASWWKWSFRLWQVRRRELASVKQFMAGDWYLEALK